MADVLTRAGLLAAPGQSVPLPSMNDEQRRILQFLLRPLVAMHDIRYPETRDRKMLDTQAQERTATLILKTLFEQIAPGVTALRDPLLRVGVRYMAHHGGQPPQLYAAAAGHMQQAGMVPVRRISHGMYAPIDLPDPNASHIGGTGGGMP